jgi:hypothetical protein
MRDHSVIGEAWKLVGQALSNDPAYREAICGLLRLHELFEAGQDESPEADAIRDRLERPWNVLSDVEKERITGLSEDLYSLLDPARERLPMSPEVERGLSDAIAARDAGDPDHALTLLRHWAKHLDPLKLVYERGRAWEEAGEGEIATLFYEFVAKGYDR